MKILIIEDEPFAQQELQRLLRQAGVEFELLACLDTVEDSVEWIRENPPPDLVFLDIQLADGLSFDIFNKVKLKSPVIFTTAYDEYAIRAFKLNSIDYLLKPIKLDELKEALEKLDSLKSQFSMKAGGVNEEQIRKVVSMLSGDKYKSRFLVKLGDQIITVDAEKVAYFKAEENVVFLVESSGKRYIIDHTLESLENNVDPSRFFRLNRGYLAEIRSIKKVNRYFNSRLSIDLEPAPGERVLVSRKRVSAFLEWLEH
jgi:DNA-binding LytR/AlgR family response regulator